MNSSPILAWARAAATGLGSAGTGDDPTTNPLSVKATGVSPTIAPVTRVSAFRVIVPAAQNTALAVETTCPIRSGPTASEVTSVAAWAGTPSGAATAEAVDRASPSEP